MLKACVSSHCVIVVCYRHVLIARLYYITITTLSLCSYSPSLCFTRLKRQTCYRILFQICVTSVIKVFVQECVTDKCGTVHACGKGVLQDCTSFLNGCFTGEWLIKELITGVCNRCELQDCSMQACFRGVFTEVKCLLQVKIIQI